MRVLSLRFNGQLAVRQQIQLFCTSTHLNGRSITARRCQATLAFAPGKEVNICTVAVFSCDVVAAKTKGAEPVCVTSGFPSFVWVPFLFQRFGWNIVTTKQDHEDTAERSTPRGTADASTTSLGTPPPVIQARSCLERTKKLIHGDRHIGRGCRQCNFQCSHFGKSAQGCHPRTRRSHSTLLRQTGMDRELQDLSRGLSWTPAGMSLHAAPELSRRHDHRGIQQTAPERV